MWRILFWGGVDMVVLLGVSFEIELEYVGLGLVCAPVGTEVEVKSCAVTKSIKEKKSEKTSRSRNKIYRRNERRDHPPASTRPPSSDSYANPIPCAKAARGKLTSPAAIILPRLEPRCRSINVVEGVHPGLNVLVLVIGCSRWSERLM